METPFRVATSDVRGGLELLREAERLLDSVPRTQEAGAADNAHDGVAAGAMVGGIVGGVLVAAATRGLPGDEDVPAAIQEYGEARDLMRRAGSALDGHLAAQGIRDALATTDSMRLLPAARFLAHYVRDLHPRLRQENGLYDAPALPNWAANDAQDVQAIEAAGLGWKSRARLIAIVVVAVAAPYIWLFSR